MKTTTSKRALATNRNVLDSERAATRAWLISLGVPEAVAGMHDFSQTIEVKTSRAGMLVRSSYAYNNRRNATRHFIRSGEVVAFAESEHNRGYQVFGRGAMEAADGEDYWTRDCGIRDFDRVAHKILRGE